MKTRIIFNKLPFTFCFVVYVIFSILEINAQDFFTPIIIGKDQMEGCHTFLKGFGKNNDPQQVFNVEDKVLRVSGQTFGYVCTEREYQNYHFIVEFKWGEQKHPPRENSKRDSGVCYHFEKSRKDTVWPVCIECQIQEGDCGDFFLLGNYPTIVLDGKRTEIGPWTRGFKKSAPTYESENSEKPHGEWNTVEIISKDGNCVHIVNGRVVNEGINSNVRKGRILIQSEGAEVYFRNARIKELGTEDGASLRVENLTKFPGTHEGFPANDWLVFSGLGYDNNPFRPGYRYQSCKEHTIRLHNEGEELLRINSLCLGDPSLFKLPGNEHAILPILVRPGTYYDLKVEFIFNSTVEGLDGIYKSTLAIHTNVGTKTINLSAAYQVGPERGGAFSMKDVAKLFGYVMQPPTSSFGSKSLGQLVNADNWQQADTGQPVAMLTMMSQDCNGIKCSLTTQNGELISEFSTLHDDLATYPLLKETSCQSVFPLMEGSPGKLSGKSVKKIEGTFKIGFQPRTDENEVKPKIYRLLNEKGQEIPNEYILIKPTSNDNEGHFQGHVFYLKNIRSIKN